MKARDIIDDAFTIAGRKALGQPLDGDTLAYGLRRLNQLIDGWKVQDMYIPVTTEIVQTVTGSPVTIGTGGTINTTAPNSVKNVSFFRIGGSDYEIIWIGQEAFSEIILKGIAGYPRYGYYENSLPLGKLYFYPQPQSMELHLRVNTTLPAFVDYDTDYTFQDGFDNALNYTMAEIACEGVRDVPADIAIKARNARLAIKERNLKAIAWDPIAVNGYYETKARFYGGY